MVLSIVAFVITLACSIAIDGSAAFTTPSNRRTLLKTLLYQSSEGNNNNNFLPFFAAPAFATQQSAPNSQSSSTTTTSSSPPQSATVTLRLPLGTLFDGRDYIFVTESNVRGYEWTTKETDILLDDLMDAALGTLGGMSEEDTVAATITITSKQEQQSTSTTIPTPTPPPALITDYELSQIVLVPTSDWNSNKLGLGNRYDVYDGQQRLVTLNLLLAGLRNSFSIEANELMSSSSSTTTTTTTDLGKGGKRAVALAATAHEISSMLLPRKVRKDDVLRITLRKRDNVLLKKILIGDDNDEVEDENDDEDVDNNIINGEDNNSIHTSSYMNMSTKQKSTLLSSLSSANTRIFQNFVHISNRLSTLSTRERLRLLDYIVERVYLLVCIPETSRIARNIVMSQGRKGMDNEPVDDFKGLVCFRYTLEEGDMYDTFDLWDSLAAEPSLSSSSTATSDSSSNAADDASSSSSSSNIKSVGRDIISSACLLRASAALRTKIRSRGGDEVYEWERWLRQELWLQNQRLSQVQQQGKDEQMQTWQGKDLFTTEIEPASIALYKFRTGQWDEFSFLSKSLMGKTKKNMTKKQRNMTIARLNFLRDITSGVPSAKEAEIVILEVLLRLEAAASSENGDGGGVISRYIDGILPSIEKWALWMAVVRPSPMQRHARVFALLDAIDDFDSLGAAESDSDMIASLREGINEYEFGASAGGKRLATAILKRMNTHLIVEDGKKVPDGIDAATVEMIQQQDWPSEEDREEWSNRIGNLALISSAQPRRRNKKDKADVSSWENKCKRYKKEPWMLTRELAELDRWGISEVQDQQKELLSSMDIVWSLYKR